MMRSVINRASIFSINRKSSRLSFAVVTVKDVSVVGVHEVTGARTAQQNSRCQPAIQKPGKAADRAGFGGVSVNNVGPFARSRR